MSHRAPLIALLLASAAFPISCSNKDDDGTGGGSGGDPGFNFGSGGMGGESGDGDTDSRSTCSSFKNLTTCNSAGVKAQPVEVNILLVVDSSGSMKTALPNDESLWDATRRALTTTLSTAKKSISFGLDLFPNAGPTTLAKACEMLDSEELVVPIAPGKENRDLITAAMSKRGPGGGTPTAAALRRAFDYFSDGAGNDLEGNRFVLLATDGGPNCNDEISCDIDTCTTNIDAPPNDKTCGGTTSCCENYAVGCLDDEGTAAAIEALAGIGVDTFVVGLPGSELYEDQLNKFAVEGGRANPVDPNDEDAPRYFKVDSEGAAGGLVDVLKKITRQLVTSCEVELEEVPTSVSLLNVAVDCIAFPFLEPGDTTGQGGEGGGATGSNPGSWYYDARTNSAILEGDICDKIETSGVESIDIIEGCPILR